MTFCPLTAHSTGNCANLLWRGIAPLLCCLLFTTSTTTHASAVTKHRVKQQTLLAHTPLAFTAWHVDSGRAGPRYLIIGAIHGDEPAGALALENLRANPPIQRGSCVLIPIAQTQAYAQHVRYPYYMADLNRRFPGKINGDATDRLAYHITHMIKAYRPALVLDLHEANEKELANTLILSPHPSSARTAMEVLDAWNEETSPPFSVLNKAPEGSLNATLTKTLGIPVITIETDRHAPLAERVALQQAMILRIIKAHSVGR